MPLKHTLLGLLQWEPMHGYKLRRYTAEYAWIYPMANASIYPALHGLESSGFISHETEIHNGRARKVYEITSAGREELRQWLAHSEREKVSHRDQNLLKIAMHNDDTIKDSQNWLEQSIQDIESELAAHQEHKLKANEMSRYAKIALEYGSALIDLRKRFLEEVLATSKAPARETIYDEMNSTFQEESKSRSA